jgi:hypothetical protein
MITESAVATQDIASRDQRLAAQPLSLSRIAAALQVVLATRRAARNEEHAYWYTVARGL